MIARVSRRPRSTAEVVLIASCLLLAAAGACFAAEATKDEATGKSAEVYKTWPFNAKEAAKRQD